MAQDDTNLTTNVTLAEHEGAADEGHATARVVAELDGCVLYQGIPHREDRDRETLAQANAIEDATRQIAIAQAKHNRAKAAAFAANPRCAKCEQPIDDPAKAMYLPTLDRLTHAGTCSVEALQRVFARAARVRVPRGRVV